MRALANLLAALACAFATPAFAQIDIGAGSTFDFGNAAIDFGCSDLNVAGSATAASGAFTNLRDLTIVAGGDFAAGASQIALGGNFTDAGAFHAGSGSVRIVDNCGTGASQLTGSTSFYDFLVSTTSGKQLILPATVTQNVSHALSLAGSAGNLLQVRSSSAGQRANLAVAGSATQKIAYVTARDNAATGAAIAPGAPAAYNSVDGGNLVNWFLAAVGGGGEPVPAPGLGLIGRLLLIVGLLSAACLAVLRRRRAET
jgi:hypothetical protein